MSTKVAKTEMDEAARLTLDLLDKLFGSEMIQDVGVRLWNGVCWPENSPRRAMIVLNHPGALREMFVTGSAVRLIEAHLSGSFDIEGDVEAVTDLAYSLKVKDFGWLWKLQLWRGLLRLPAGQEYLPDSRGRAKLSGERHSIKRDRQAIAYHYDVSNDFYALWLDRHMVYSCAYFMTADDDLDTAQENKLDYLCRKLRLQPGQRLLDVGCGWGGLVIFAAKHFGVDVTGITLSKPQANLANERIATVGLAQQCRVKVQDYREVDEEMAYDALVSVGMFEHVGDALLPGYFTQAWQLLKPGGVFLNHGIADRATNPRSRYTNFTNTYVFPDGELVPINRSLHTAEEVGFEVRDVESLREHYAMTLRHWVRRLEAQRKQALQFVNEPTYRVWRLFMSGSAYGFAVGILNVYQTLLVRPDEQGRSGLPLTRSGWYNDG